MRFGLILRDTVVYGGPHHVPDFRIDYVIRSAHVSAKHTQRILKWKSE